MFDYADTWRFSLCGTSISEIHECSSRIRDTELEVHRYLKQHLPGGDLHSIFTFHLAHERCDILRPLDDLFQTCRPQNLDGELVMVHQTCDGASCDSTTELIDVGKDVNSDVPMLDVDTEDGHTHCQLPRATIHLDFDTSHLAGNPIADEVWEEDTFEVDMTATMTDLEDSIRSRVTANLGVDDELLSIMTLRGVDAILGFSISQVTSVPGQAYLKVTNLNRVEMVADLFTDPTTTDGALNVIIALELLSRPAQASTQPYRKISDHSLELTSAERVVAAWTTATDYDAYEYETARLGTCTRLRQESRAENDNDTHTLKLKAITGATKWIPQVEVLIGFYFKGHDAHSHDLKIASALAWDFRDYCIGDLSQVQDHEYSPYDGYFAAYRGNQNKSDLHRKIQRELEIGRKTEQVLPQKQQGSGLPFLPAYTYNRFDPQEHGPGVAKVTILAVVHFVNRLPKPIPGDGTPLKLPHSTQYRFDYGETSGTICWIHLRPYLRAPEEHAEEDTNAHELLCSDPLLGKWDIQLWVLPQDKSIKKMYRFPTGREGSTGLLGEFLTKRKVLEGDYKLYVEAHIVPKEG